MGDVSLGADGVGVAAWTWDEVRQLLHDAIGARVTETLAGPVEVVGLRVLTPDGTEVALDDATWLAGVRRSSS